MSKTTTNYGLVKPELTDVADITAMNENWDKIDQEMKELSKVVPIERGGTGATTAEDALVNLGGAKVEIGSYVGTGTYGKDNPNRLTISENTHFIIVKQKDGQTMFFAFRDDTECTGFIVNSIYDIVCTWSENEVSWYDTDATKQLNISGETYNYVIVG